MNFLYLHHLEIATDCEAWSGNLDDNDGMTEMCEEECVIRMTTLYWQHCIVERVEKCYMQNDYNASWKWINLRMLLTFMHSEKEYLFRVIVWKVSVYRVWLQN